MSKRKISFSDSPSEQDELNIENIIHGLSNLVKNAERPFVLALIGDWGSGKTTLVNLALNRLNGIFTIIHFNAWSHTKGTPLLKGLFLHLASKKGGPWEKMKGSLTKLIESPISSSLVRGTGVMLGPQYLTASEMFGQLIEKIGIHLKRKREQEDDVEHLISNFKKVALTFEEQNNPLLIFIDDLDRCSPIEALDFIDDIKVYLSIEAPVIFIVAIDKRTLSMGIRAKYGRDVEISVDDYLHKIFSYTVNMPIYSELDILLENIIRSNRKSDEYDVLSPHVIKDIFRKLEINSIRSIRKIVQRWYFLIPHNINDVLRVSQVPDKDGLKSDPSELSRFILLLCVLFELYPHYYEALCDFRHILPIPFPIEKDGGIPEERRNILHSMYLKSIGYVGLEEDEALRLRAKDKRLEQVFSLLLQSRYLTNDDFNQVKEAYKISVPHIMDSVRLGLPIS